MGKLVSQFIKEAERQGIASRELPMLKAQAVRAKVTRRFAGGNEAYPLWDCLEGDWHSYQGEQTWRRIAEFPTDHPLIVFFEAEDDASMIELHDPRAIVAVVSETIWDEFYVTDLEATLLLCVNDHDILIGAGAAADWVDGLR